MSGYAGLLLLRNQKQGDSTSLDYAQIFFTEKDDLAVGLVVLIVNRVTTKYNDVVTYLLMLVYVIVMIEIFKRNYIVILVEAES